LTQICGLLLGVFMVAFLLPLAGWAQTLPQPGAKPQQGGMGGNATGGTFAPVYDSDHRPITAGGFVETGPDLFEDITKSAGLSVWSHKMGTPDKKFIVDTDGSGVALLDYDNDGWLDIYLVNGATFDALDGKETLPHAALFHNNHDGTFTDVASHAGVTNDRWGFGVTIGDFDNDGWPDIFVANYGNNRLFHNNHDGTFTDVAEKAGVTLGNWSAGATWGDYDGDGRWSVGSVCLRVYTLRPQGTAGCRQQGIRQHVLPVSRSPGDVRPARPEGRARPPVSQQRRWHLY
jgi:hypothetical protein